MRARSLSVCSSAVNLAWSMLASQLPQFSRPRLLWHEGECVQFCSLPRLVQAMWLTFCSFSADIDWLYDRSLGAWIFFFFFFFFLFLFTCRLTGLHATSLTTCILTHPNWMLLRMRIFFQKCHNILFYCYSGADITVFHKKLWFVNGRAMVTLTRHASKYKLHKLHQR